MTKPATYGTLVTESGLIYDNTTRPGSTTRDFRETLQTPAEAVLVSGVDATAGRMIEQTLTAARLIGAPLNAVVGQRLDFALIQGGAGAFAVTWNAIFKGITGGTSGATGTRATFAFEYDGSNWNLIGAQPTWV